MKRRPRMWRVVTRVGAGVCVALGAMYVASIQRTIGYSLPCYAFGISGGNAFFFWTSYEDDSRGWYEYPAPRSFGLELPRLFNEGPMKHVHIPLWIPLLAVAMPSVFFWRRDRRPPPGHCQTGGYDLTGATSGRCPECGEAI